jgi:hypothetical protein
LTRLAARKAVVYLAGDHAGRAGNLAIDEHHAFVGEKRNLPGLVG